MNEKKNNFNHLVNGDVSSQICKIAVPASVGFFFNTMYNVVDTYFAGAISTDATAAISLSFPVFFLVIAMSFGIGTGVTALVSNALGAGDNEKARIYSLQGLSFSVILGVLVGAVGYFIAPSLFRFLGAEGEYLKIATAYMNVILLSAVFFSLVHAMNGVLNARGDTVTFRNFLIMGFFLNLLFDPALIYGWFGLPALGFIGVAWATLFIKFIGTIYVGTVLKKRNILCGACLRDFVPDMKVFKKIGEQSFPASLNMMTIAVGVFVITYYVSEFGKEAVAAYGIATRVDQIALLPAMGLNIAAVALIGQNNGAKKFDRCRDVYKKVMRYGLIISAIGMFGVFLFSYQLMSFFSDNSRVVDIGNRYLLISIWIYLAYTILFMVTSVLQGLKKPNFAIWIGVYRQIVAPLIVFYLFVQVLKLGIWGVWWGVFAINWTAVVISLYYVNHVMKKMFNRE